MAFESQYSEAILESSQEIFGEGFLSPGGAAEVARMLAGHAPAGGEVLDWGCGIGGSAIALAQHVPGASVLGIDVEQGSLERATAHVAAASLDARVSFMLVVPGPLPLATTASSWSSARRRSATSKTRRRSSPRSSGSCARAAPSWAATG